MAMMGLLLKSLRAECWCILASAKLSSHDATLTLSPPPTSTVPKGLYNIYRGITAWDRYHAPLGRLLP